MVGVRISSAALAAFLAVGLFAAGVRVAQAAPSLCGGVVGNLVTNCGFESAIGFNNVPGWTTGGVNGAVLSLTSLQNSGDRSLFMNFDAPGSAFASQAVGGAGSYDVSFWLMLYTQGVPSNAAPTLEIIFGDQNLAVTVPPNNLQDVVYTEFRFTNVTTTAPAELRFAMSGAETGRQYHNFLVDDVVVTARPSQVPEPSSIALVLAALVGFSASRRGRQAGHP
jgi:hypothetical protein